MGRALGLDVVAEGVETQETCEMLASLNGLLIQGYHISRPLPPAELLQWAATAFSQADELSA
jgi:EAL domain-containing protein (putative c-di-GMP-specific phosphodiesterase class I)